ncbi:ATP-binding protein [Leeuwenhoekiella parthenopeia]|uniref:histidine kinase n=1 Tax=Leeuwenhoekiella parthenopeia TaxID=2890320 RepID=A0ABS8GW52_9FLAO|nr:sensor histidine kinase [Leeuwenhoekiella parthenopeia]MCC4214182.1 sensor histidine kinase [Leeuwenhoekiella parthenopeia]
MREFFSFRYIKSLLFFLGILLGLLSCSSPSENKSDEQNSNLIDFDVSLQKIENLDQIIPNDSVRLSILSKLSLEYLNKDSTLFRKINAKALNLAHKLSDKDVEANAYWDLAYFYGKNSSLDSSYASYYKAYQKFSELNHEAKAGKMMLMMAISQEKARDYIGSENSSFKALELLPEKKKKDIHAVHNNLAIIYNGLGDFKKAIEHHKLAIKTALEINDQELLANSFNNIAVVFLENGFYKDALSYVKQALLVNDLKQMDTELYAMTLDNYAYIQLKAGESEDFLKASREALYIRDSVDHKAGIMVSRIRLGEYYLDTEDTARALSNLQTALALAQDEKNAKYELEALLKLHNITGNQDYLDRYLVLNEQLLNDERGIRSKFARIRYETDQYINKNKSLTERIIWISFTAVVLLTLLGVFLFLQRQKANLIEARMQNSLKESNAEVFKLLLDQQKKVEIAAVKERERIARDLHDGVISRLFGTRMALGFIESDNPSTETHLKELQNIEAEIRNVSHNLVSNSLTSEDGVEKLIKKLIDTFNEHTATSFELTISESIDFSKLEDSVKISIYYIIQECLQNVMKHANATVCKVALRQKEKTLSGTIADNGAGFEAKTAKDGIGLTNLRYRITDLGGTLNIHSDSSGTQIAFNIPL